MVGYPRVPAGRLVVERSRRRSRGPARHQIPRRRPGRVAAPKSARALDGFGCPTEAPYGCFLPDLTRFGTCRHPNPSNALGARYILPAPARWGKTANLGRGLFDYFLTGGLRTKSWTVKVRFGVRMTYSRAVVERAGELRRSGLSCREIARELDGPSKSASSWRTPSSGR